MQETNRGGYRHGLVWLAVFCVIAMMFLRLPHIAARQDAVLTTYSALVEVDALARQEFVEAIHDDRLVDGAIRGMMLQLDPYSGYISPKELPAFQRRSRGSFFGIGIELGMQRGRLTVIAPIDGSPAAKAGVRAGDTLVAINGRELEGRSVFDVEELLGGAPGSPVRLRILHTDESDTTELSIVRGPVSLTTVRGFCRDVSGNWSYTLDPDEGLAYVRISGFLDNTMRDFDEILGDLVSLGLRGLIIDLRFNPGGLMRQAVDLTDRFVDHGAILSTVTRRRAVQEFRATRPGTLKSVALAVLINDASASSSEIVAGSLQALGRAIVVGKRSFGKGSVQHLIPLAEHGAAIKLTTAYYRLPDGRIIHRTPKNAHTDAWGIIPDVVIELSEEEKKTVLAYRRALDGGSTEATLPPVHEAGDVKAQCGIGGRSLIPDRQLLEALTQLRRRLAQGDDPG